MIKYRLPGGRYPDLAVEEFLWPEQLRSELSRNLGDENRLKAAY
jgi:hypothetical protein